MSPYMYIPIFFLLFKVSNVHLASFFKEIEKSLNKIAGPRISS